MGWMPALGSPVLLGCAGVLAGALLCWLVVRRLRASKAPAVAELAPRPRVAAYSQVLTVVYDDEDDLDLDDSLDDSSLEDAPRAQLDASSLDGSPLDGSAPANDVVSVHEAKTREFAAYAEELASLSMQSGQTGALAVEERPTRELSVVADTSSSGLCPRSAGRREDDDTLKITTGGDEKGRRDQDTEELLRWLGPDPSPSLDNIEVYYRLALSYLAANQDALARHCFLTVEEISPGYRDVSRHLALLPVVVPKVSGAAPTYRAREAESRREPTQPGKSRRSR